MLTARDAQRLQGVHPVLVAAIEDVFAELNAAGTPMFVVCGIRTSEEQAALYAQGRTMPGPIVTYCDGVIQRSDHEPEGDGYGHAVDCAFIPTKQLQNAWDPQWPWAAFGDALERRGIAWGGRFKRPADLDHAQYVVPTTASA